MVPSYYGGKFPLSTYLASRVRALLANPDRHGDLPEQAYRKQRTVLKARLAEVLEK